VAPSSSRGLAWTSGAAVLVAARHAEQWPLRLFALLATFATSGCFATRGLWSLSPRYEARELLDARAGQTDDLEFERDDGTRMTWSFGQDEHYFRFQYVADPHDELEPPWNDVIQDPVGLVSFPSSLSPIPLHYGRAMLIEIHAAEGTPIRAWITPAADGPLRWPHPGVWLCTAVMPVTATIDVVTFPLQAIVYALVVREWPAWINRAWVW
jgi:hypothetical protein